MSMFSRILKMCQHKTLLATKGLWPSNLYKCLVGYICIITMYFRTYVRTNNWNTMYTVRYISLQHQIVFLDHNIPFSSKSSYMISNGYWSSSIDAINRVVTVIYYLYPAIWWGCFHKTKCLRFTQPLYYMQNKILAAVSGYMRNGHWWSRLMKNGHWWSRLICYLYLLLVHNYQC